MVMSSKKLSLHSPPSIHFHQNINFSGKRRLNFANFITKERLNFPAVNRYRLDIMTLEDFMTGKLSAH
jgi:hypothetical protein